MVSSSSAILKLTKGIGEGAQCQYFIKWHLPKSPKNVKAHDV